MNKTKHFKRLWSLMLLLIAMLLPQGAWASTHYDAGFGSTETTYSAAGIKFKVVYLRMYNYQGNNSHFNSNPLVTITAGGHTHTFNLGSLTGESGNSTFYYNGEGNEDPYKKSGSFSKVTYEQTVDGIPVKAYFDNQKNDQYVSGSNNGGNSSKWCTADLTIEIGVQTAATVTIKGNWRDQSDGINRTESYSWPFDIPKHTCNSDIQSPTNTYLKSAATCTAAAVYYESCSWCGAAQSGTFTSGSALGHNYGNGSWSWGNDGHSATCTRTCSNDANHKSSVSVTLGNGITSAQQVAPKCTEMGTTRYTATATVEGTQYSATKDVIDIAALGHSYGAGAWSWADDGHSATCTRTCGRTNCYTNTPGHTSSKSVTLGNGITSELTEAATCSKKGSHTYTATTTVENVEYSDSKEVADIDIDPLNHNYGAGAWSWGNDGHSATCTRTCSNDANHKSSVSVTLGNGITSAQQVAPKCTEMGTTRYTATATVEGAQYSDTKDVDDIAATGLHTFDDVTDPHHTLCTVCKHSFFRYTSSTEDVVNPNNVNELKGANGAKLDFTNTYVDGQGVMEFKGTLKTIGKDAFLNCSGFTGNLTIPNSVTSIGTSAFEGCSGFTGVEFQSVPQIGSSTFNQVNCSKTVVLSDDSYVYTGENPYFPEVQSATYTRRGIKNQFGTLVVPFDVNGMGADYDLYKLDQVLDYELVLRKVDEDDNGGIVPAGTPVVFRLHDGLAGNHTLTLTASNTTVSGQLEERSEDNDFQLVGTYETIELYDSDYFISNNMFFRVYDAKTWVGGVKVAPFRAYLSHNPWSSAKAQTLSIRIADEDDDVTAVETLNAITDGTAEYYDMNGRRINSLQKGVNIVKYGNGKTLKVNIK